MEYSRIKVSGKKTGDIDVDEDRMLEVTGTITTIKISGKVLYASERTEGNLEGKAIYLDHSFDWVLGKDSEGSICLVPLIKRY